MSNLYSYDEAITERVEIFRRRLVTLFAADRQAFRGSLEADFSPWVDRISHDLMGRIVATLAAGRTHRSVLQTEDVPADWWQAVRQRWLPRWWLAHWPVRVREIETLVDVTHVCPHIDVDATFQPGERSACIHYLAEKPEAE